MTEFSIHRSHKYWTDVTPQLAVYRKLDGGWDARRDTAVPTEVTVLSLAFVQNKMRGPCLLNVSDMLDFSWEKFDEQVSAFTTLRHLIIGFVSLDDLAMFAYEVEHRMPNLLHSGRLRYAVWNGQRGVSEMQWIPCTRYSTKEGNL